MSWLKFWASRCLPTCHGLSVGMNCSIRAYATMRRVQLHCCLGSRPADGEEHRQRCLFAAGLLVLCNRASRPSLKGGHGYMSCVNFF
jgi:hypothetical protein